MSKYGAKKTTFQGRTFDSKREAERFAELRYMQMGGLISDLRTQVRFILIPNQYDEETGKLIERAVTYVADFVYDDLKTCKTVVEDAKGCRTKDYIIKRKLMLQVHGIRIREV
jgi:hypothetical protein